MACKTTPTEAQLSALFTFGPLSSPSTLFLLWYRLTTNLPDRLIAAFHNELFASSIASTATATANAISSTSRATEWTVADVTVHGATVIASGTLDGVVLQAPDSPARCPCYFGIDCTQPGIKKRRERGRVQREDLVLAAQIWHADTDSELLACPDGWTTAQKKPKPGTVRLDACGNRVPAPPAPPSSLSSPWWRPSWLQKGKGDVTTSRGLGLGFPSPHLLRSFIVLVFDSLSSLLLVVVEIPRSIPLVVLLLTLAFLVRFFVLLTVPESWNPSSLFASSADSSALYAFLKNVEAWASVAETTTAGGDGWLNWIWIWQYIVPFSYVMAAWALIYAFRRFTFTTFTTFTTSTVGSSSIGLGMGMENDDDGHGDANEHEQHNEAEAEEQEHDE